MGSRWEPLSSKLHWLCDLGVRCCSQVVSDSLVWENLANRSSCCFRVRDDPSMASSLGVKSGSESVRDSSSTAASWRRATMHPEFVSTGH